MDGLKSYRNAFSRWTSAACLLLLPALFNGCSSNTTKVTLTLTPSTTQVLDAGQSLALSASVVDATNGGLTWTLTSGPGQLAGIAILPGTAGSATTVETDTYYAPATISASTTATITVASVTSPGQSGTFNITLNPALTSTAASLPAGNVGVAYSSATLVAAGGSGPLTYQVSSGIVPAGLSFSAATGVLSGTPTAVGTYTFTVSATDAATMATTTSQTFTLTVISVVTITTPSPLPAAAVNTPYSQQLASSGGTGTGYVYTLSSGTLPAGLTLSTGGLLSGTATTSGTSSFTVQVADPATGKGSKAFTLTVGVAPLVITTSTLPSGNTGVAYSQQLAYSGGPGGTPTFTLASGSLPAGLSLSAAGLISGSPTTVGSSTFAVTVTVGTTTSAAQSYTVTISNLAITTSSAAFGEVALPFSFPEAVIGGTGPYKWSLAAGSNALPTGLAINAGTGQLSGTPTTAGVTTVNVMVSDSLGNSTSKAVVITINAARTAVDNAQFSGQYAFLLTGFDTARNPLTWIGKLTADGAGNITGGTLDVNGISAGAAQTAQVLLPSTYTVGADNRGRVTVTTAAGSTTFVLALNKPATTAAGTGYLTETDATGQSLTGTILLEDPTAFTLPSLTGGYAFGLNGYLGSSKAHVGEIGQLQLTGAGVVGSSEQIASQLGGTPVVSTAGVYTVSPTGRGTLSLTLSGGGTQTFVLYVVSARQVLLASSATASGAGGAPLLSGQAALQTTGGFTLASLKGTSVGRISRLTPAGSGAATTYTPDVQLGVYTFNGTSQVSLAADDNAGGVATTVAQQGKYSVASNGRVAAYLGTGIGGCIDCSSAATFLYLSAPNAGFALDVKAGVGTGSLEAQTAGASIIGTYASGTVQPLSQLSTLGIAAVNVSGTGTLSETEDQNTDGLVVPDKAVTATYTAAANGRIAVKPSDTTLPVIYLVTPTRAFSLDLGTVNPTLSVLVQ